MQDDIRLTPKLTVSAGLRYEVSPPLYDIRHQMSSIDFSTAPSPVAIFAAGKQGVYSPEMFVCGKDGYPEGCAYTTWHNFSPRLGLAWSVDAKTVIRAGAGLYYGTQDDNTLLKMAQTLPTTYAQTLTFNAYVPQNPGLNVFTPAVVGTQAVTAASIDLHQGTPYSPQWSFNIQRSLGSQTLVEIGYLGTAGIHLEQNVQVNNSMPGTAVKRPYYGLTLAPAVQSELQFPLSNTTVPGYHHQLFPAFGAKQLSCADGARGTAVPRGLFAAELVHLLESHFQRPAIPQLGRYYRKRELAAAEFLRPGGGP